MATYFASDVHLRFDYPERGRRFGHWVSGLGGDETLWIAGDLCDFWYQARQRHVDPRSCPGLRALADFRSRGGTLNIIPGNHDRWLGPFYEDVLGASFLPEPVDIEAYGLRIRIVHGHMLGARPYWKECMEAQAFLRGFSLLPSPIAHVLDWLMNLSNQRSRLASEERHLKVYRRYARERAGWHDLMVFGHVHRTVDESQASPRVVVLGGWHDRASFLKIDESGAKLITEADPAVIPC